ncbi:MAG TPA: RNA polymerase sigma factor RpoH [Alphaproteobacteria bacterium]|nr:RNA polymerase sigma factor RpoH [Alphaproteobacteria bacterium]
MEPGRFVTTRDDMSRYIQQVRSVPMLTLEDEQELSRRWRDRHDISAAHELVSSHLRLVIKIARGYRGYGLPSDDLIGEGQLGLMRAVCRFDPDRGARFATYATWWVHAAIREYVLHNWSLVKIGTTGAQKKLFFNLRRARRHLQILDDGALSPENVSHVSEMLQVPEHEVISMGQRMAGPDLSLNAPSSVDSETEWQSYLVDDKDGQDTLMAEYEESERRKSLLNAALGRLTTRERHIIAERHLKETPATLAALSLHYGISNERVRQIEMRAMVKLQRSMLA